MIETIDSEKLADKVNKSWGQLERSTPLKIMVQVNTSNEPRKLVFYFTSAPCYQTVHCLKHI